MISVKYFIKYNLHKYITSNVIFYCELFPIILLYFIKYNFSKNHYLLRPNQSFMYVAPFFC